MTTRHTITLERYLKYRLGSEYKVNPIGAMLRRSFGARSYTAFWQYWNPVYGYYLYRFCYRHLRSILPRNSSVIFTFAVCGFVLHDMPFGWLILAIVTGRFPFPFVAVWFTMIGITVTVSEAAHMDLRGASFPTRLIVNAIHIVISFIITMSFMRIIYK